MKDPLQDNSLGKELALPAGLGEELFVYCPEVLEKLSPNPLDNSEALNAENRRETAAAWEEALKNRLDDSQILHALAVLWYWTARADECAEAWLTTMGYWCSLTACKSFWSQEKGAEHGAEAREYVLSELRRGVPTVRLQTELAAVEVMRKAGLHIRHALLTQGPALLAHLELTAEVGQVVEELIAQSPEEERFQAVRHIFSPYYSIRVLIDEGEFEKAQRALEELDPEELQLTEVKDLLSALFVKQGRRLIKAGNLALGIERWQEAMKLGLSGLELEQLNTEGKKHIIDASGSWPKLGRRDAIIELIESWLTNSEDEALKNELSTLLLNRGRSAICAAEDLAVTSSDKADKGIILDTLERGRRDIARAKEIGGEVAEGQLKVADRVIAEVRYGVLDLTSQIKELARAACELMTHNEWDKAIETIHEARALVVSGRPHVLDRFLADCLANKVKTRVEDTFVSYQEGLVDRQQLRSVINDNSDELLKAQELDLLNNTVERTRQRIDEVLHQTGVSISDEVHKVVEQADKASAANDWDESIRLLLDVFDSVGSKSAPRFLKKRLAAVLANRAGAYYDTVRTKTAPEGERRKLALAAREDLRDAAFFDPENEVIQSTLERVESTLLDLPDEITAPVIEQARTAAEGGNWDIAFEVLRTSISQGPRPAPTSTQSALADLLYRRASELEPKERLGLLFEALLMSPENHVLKAEVERTIHDFAQTSPNAEVTETALTLAFVHAQKGEWPEAIEPIEASYPKIATLMKLGRNSELAVKLGKMAGNEVLHELPIVGCHFIDKDSLDPDVKLVEAFQETTARAISSRECSPLRDELVRLLDLTTPLTALFEAVDNKDWSQCDKLLKSERASNILADKIIKGVHQVILLHQVDLLLSTLRKGETEGAQRNAQLNSAKRLLVTASAIETVSPHRVEAMMRSYDETIEQLGEDTVSVSTFADDTFWWWFIAITTGAGVITLIYYLAQG